MGKTKVKKQNTFIDMTAMSDVTVLLLTFFMLTATFLPMEPVQVTTPASVSEVKIPEANSLTILIDLQGRVFMNLDRPADKKAALEAMGESYGLQPFNNAEIQSFVNQSHIGVPMNRMHAFLAKDAEEQKEEMKKLGIPTDSTNNQLARWVKAAKTANPDLLISIKADRSTPFPYVNNVMKTLVDIDENRYNLITILKGMPEGF